MLLLPWQKKGCARENYCLKCYHKFKMFLWVQISLRGLKCNRGQTDLPVRIGRLCWVKSVTRLWVLDSQGWDVYGQCAVLQGKTVVESPTDKPPSDADGLAPLLSAQCQS